MPLVQGNVRLEDRTAYLVLSEQDTTPPSPSEVKAWIMTYGIETHSSRFPMLNQNLQVAVSNVQRKLGLQIGPQGGWTDGAWQLLAKWLRQKKQVRSNGLRH